MHFPRGKLEARVALENERREEHQILPRQRGGDDDDDDEPVDPIASFFSDILGLNPTTTSTTRTSTRTTLTPTTATRPTAVTPSVVTPPVVTRPTSTSSRTSTTLSTAEVVTTPPPQSTRTSFSTLSVTSTNTGNTNISESNDSSSKSGLPSVVVGVIVAASIIFGLIFLALIVRKIFQSRRRSRRATWARNSTISPFEPTIQEKALPPPPVETQPQPQFASYPAYPPAAMSYANNNNNVAPYSPAAASSAGYPSPYAFAPNAGNLQAPSTNGNALFNSAAYAPADLAGPVVIQTTPPTPSTATTNNTSSAPVSVVKRTFVPSLPDELSISTGDQVRVLSVYDDGWALCEKLMGRERGVVPQECLDKLPQANSNTPEQQIVPNEDTRLNRNSSLRRNKEQTY